MTSVERALIEYGLKEKHAKVYVGCLELGSASVLRISRKVQLPRSTCEIVLEHLKQKEFVYSFKKKRIKYFSPEDPKKVIELVKQKSAELEKMLPAFKELYARASIIPTVRFYTGKEGIKNILREILEDASNTKELLAWSSVDDLVALLGKDFYNFVKNRVALGLPSRVILRDSEKARERLRLGASELRQVRLISPDYTHHALTYIWGNKIAMVSLKDELSVLLIESEELAQTQRMLFNSLWDSLPDMRHKFQNA